MKISSFGILPWLRIAAACAAGIVAAGAGAATPRVGDLAPNFSLRTLDNKGVDLPALCAKRPVLLIVLRGWPGYQCPICARQVHDFVDQADAFAKKNIQVLMVYPGPADQLKAHAEEFLADKNWPADFLFVIDPDYTFTNAYGLRWDAPRETAYPSTFVIDKDRHVRFAHVSKTHGDRVEVAHTIEAVAAVK